mgnify:CR=1 FL=1
MAGLAVDNSNNIFAIRCLQTPTDNVDVKIIYELCMCENFSVKHDFILDVITANKTYGKNIAINDTKDIIIAMTKIPIAMYTPATPTGS